MTLLKTQTPKPVPIPETSIVVSATATQVISAKTVNAISKPQIPLTYPTAKQIQTIQKFAPAWDSVDAVSANATKEATLMRKFLASFATATTTVAKESMGSCARRGEVANVGASVSVLLDGRGMLASALIMTTVVPSPTAMLSATVMGVAIAANASVSMKKSDIRGSTAMSVQRAKGKGVRSCGIVWNAKFTKEKKSAKITVLRFLLRLWIN